MNRRANDPTATAARSAIHRESSTAFRHEPATSRRSIPVEPATKLGEAAAHNRLACPIRFRTSASTSPVRWGFLDAGRPGQHRRASDLLSKGNEKYLREPGR